MNFVIQDSVNFLGVSSKAEEDLDIYLEDHPISSHFVSG